ncbi:MAG: hypothetical protein Q9187_000224 [Circinaria calcarea]
MAGKQAVSSVEPKRSLTRALFQEAEVLLEKWKHPDPYRPPTAPGGSKYERNIPPPILDRKNITVFQSRLICR